MPWRGPEHPGEYPTLGYLIADWIEDNLVIPDGARRGQRLILTDEQLRHLLQSYRLKPNARADMGSQAFRYYGSLLVRPQKALALDTPIPTPSGWAKMADLQVGDHVFAASGAVTRVAIKSPVFLEDAYRVRFGDGSSLVACGEHEWEVEQLLPNGDYARVRRSAKDLLAAGLTTSRGMRFSVPDAGALDLPEADLPVPPYTLGAWLGDGDSDGGRITKPEPEIYEPIRAEGFRVEQRSPKRYQVFGLKPLLAHAGTLRDKHIPAAYLRASREQRWALLQGLMDTDGYVDPKGRCEFCTTSPALRDGVQELLSTLGIKYTLGEGRAMLNGRDYGPKWRICFRVWADSRLFHISRKQERLFSPERARARCRLNRIMAIELLGKVPTQCVTVEDRSHTILAGDRMTVTGQSGKDPFAAAQACAQALGPVRFDGWDADGEPVGAPMSTPWIQCAANSEDQVVNTFQPIFVMLSEGPLADVPGLDVGLTRVNLPSGGRIEPVTAQARSRLGARITYATFTEALALHTPIPTPTGWTTMGEVQVGDEVLGADGLPTRVIKATPVQADRACYRVTFKDGTSVIASDGHQWSTRVTGQPHRHTVARVRTTQQMADDGRRFSIPVAPPMKSPDVELPTDPYVLGLWLGDGSSRGATITMGDQDREELMDLVRARGYTAEQEADRLAVRVSLPGVVRGRWGGRDGRPTSLQTVLRQQALLRDKHIPAQYLRAGTEQRMELLRGLMDSDGCATKQSGYVFFGQDSKQLVDDFVELVRSLGQVATVKWYSSPRSRQGGHYRVGFQPRWGLQPFNLRRKAERVRARSHRDGWTSITSIDPVPSEPVRCIAVDAPDHLFLAGDGWHVTHNSGLYTETSGGLALARTMKRGLAGMDGRWIEITNAWDPSENSVAQRTWEAKAPGVFLDYRPPRLRVDLDDDQALRNELAYVYGDSAIEQGGWVNLERIMEEIRNPATGEGEARRFFLNEVTVGSRDAVDSLLWAAQARPGELLKPTERIALGFRGTQTKDATSLCASRLSDGRLFHLRTWEKPPHVPAGQWSVPRDEVDLAVKQAFTAYDVIAMFATPAGWQTEVNVWAGEFEKRVLELWLNSEMRMDQVVERFLTAHRGGELTHDGSDTLTAHAQNAALANGRRRASAEDRQPGQTDHYQRVVAKGQGMTTSAFVAALLAYEARGWAIERGALVQDEGPPNLW